MLINQKLLRFLRVGLNQEFSEPWLRGKGEIVIDLAKGRSIIVFPDLSSAGQDKQAYV